MIRSLSALFLIALAGCAKEEQLRVTDAWVRYSPVRENPSAAYFTVRGGPQDVSLIGVSTEVAIRSEMHETMAGQQGMAAMKPVTSVQVPAGSEVKFEPGGKHVMLWSINPGIKPPKRITLTFSFSNGERIQADAPLVAAGEPAPTQK
ncbi:copper chaperone PCu(A)C [Sphingomonas sp.]|jgi:hypothetical protein|uniref:copper chaperone PCu(A)C n=1 Tax=Sphingomonas sp. TaxID=28214 RepID=UPI002DE96FDA|nr:copper chaperone PCu(A)C [Sphingomonas sp.]